MKHDPDLEDRSNHELTCSDARLQASAWIDAQLPASEELRLHLEACGDCRMHVEELRGLSARLGSLRAALPVADLWPAIAARVQAGTHESKPWPARGRRIAAALIGFAITAACLQWAESTARSSDDLAQDDMKWPGALHEELASIWGVSATPEQRLLGSIEAARGER